MLTENSNFEVAIADVEVLHDGEAASRRVLEETFFLVLLDVMLPRKDGFEVYRGMRRAKLRSAIVLLTAKAEEAEKVLGPELGADDYVIKPFSPRELRALKPCYAARPATCPRSTGSAM